jgi:hypothetical protein
VFSEPRFVCTNCTTECSLQEAVGGGMACTSCGARLKAARGPVLIGSGQQANGKAYVAHSLEPMQVAEVWLSAHNESDAELAHQFILALPEPTGLEFFAPGSRRSMLVRGGGSSLEALAGRLNAAWPALGCKF